MRKHSNLRLSVCQTPTRWTARTRCRGFRTGSTRRCRTTSRPAGSSTEQDGCSWPSPCYDRPPTEPCRLSCGCTATATSPSTNCCWRCSTPRPDCVLSAIYRGDCKMTQCTWLLAFREVIFLYHVCFLAEMSFRIFCLWDRSCSVKLISAQRSSVTAFHQKTLKWNRSTHLQRGFC